MQVLSTLNYFCGKLSLISKGRYIVSISTKKANFIGLKNYRLRYLQERIKLLVEMIIPEKIYLCLKSGYQSVLALSV